MSQPPPRVAERPKGVVDPALARRMFRLERYLPSPALSPHLDHFWLVEWDLRGKPDYTQRTLPYPCVNLVFDAGRTAIFGVMRGAFDYTLTGAGCVLGLRFRPGAFRALLKRPLHTITDRIVPLSEVFGVDAVAAERQVLGAGDDATMIAAAEAFLAPHATAGDPKVDELGGILAAIEGNPLLNRVEQLAGHTGLGMRTLQQLFSNYVGVSPKWVIRRYRLHEAADRLANGAAVDLADLAHALGYYDQAHFTRDFQKLVGRPPQAYREAQPPTTPR
ncbi:AraC family transcriptional regulator [Bordetella genomosp. 11]|uniref:AraC family transcriptional regulator n=1 Tax=Bordetella genomosp. 11 TaxID=1416808 RepID=A0A261V182_9BORD|nr:helix-turn-helix domain-containing protein [Bordetella genomosp. 11]OZI67280.1 AraC family transcriptional regulator [Bordetella genomosp. 11]